MTKLKRDKKKKRDSLIKKIKNLVHSHLRNHYKAKRRYHGCPSLYCNRAFPGNIRIAGRYSRRKWTREQKQMAEG